MGYRYIGAKTKIIPEIIQEIGRIVGKDKRISDLMCGTAAVSAALRENGYRVTANDIMTYAYHHARVSLLFNKEPTFVRAMDFVTEFSPVGSKTLFSPTPYERTLRALSRVPPRNNYFWREFSPDGSPNNVAKPRNYFSAENACRIDGIRYWIRWLKDTKKINDLEHSLLLHDLVMAANDVANIAGTYGHYLANIRGRAKDPLCLRPTRLLIRDDKGKHNAYKEYAELIANKISCDLCYIDPPYMKRQYAANYHVLETIAREDEPEAIGISGLRPWRDQYSNFCTKTRIEESFRKIFGEMHCSHFLVSYSEDGLLTLEHVEKLFSEFGKVRTMTIKNKRFKSHSYAKAPMVTEYLIHLQKR